ncbi:hypothetical protein TNCV_2220561 [Trichonephila clavipes]|nr:hypothetical protein TNCV_2220561 [Trichonephila clavipes]
MRIWNHRVAEGHIERHARSTSVRINNALLGRNITEGNSGDSNDKPGYRSGTSSSFQASPASLCNIPMAVYASGAPRKPASISYRHS